MNDEIEEKLKENVKISLKNFLKENEDNSLDDSQISSLISIVFNNCLYLDDLDEEEVYEADRTVTMARGGVGGGVSQKANYITLKAENIKEAANNVSSYFNPTLLSSRSLLISRIFFDAMLFFYKSTKISLTERHTMVIWVVLVNGGHEKFINKKDLLDFANEHFSKSGRDGINLNELDIILNDLTNIKCFEKNGREEFRLSEELIFHNTLLK